MNEGVVECLRRSPFPESDDRGGSCPAWGGGVEKGRAPDKKVPVFSKPLSPSPSGATHARPGWGLRAS